MATPSSVRSVRYAYDDSRIFALNYNGLLRAFDAASGTLAWSVQLPGQYSFTSPPTALGGVVYTGGAGSGGTVYAVRESDGAVLWTAAVMNGDHSSPAVSGTGVYVTYACQQDYAFAPSSGALLWHHATGCEGGGGKTPVLAGSTVYSRDIGSDLRLDAATGTEQGTFSSDTAPAFDGTRVFVRSGTTLSAVDPSTQATLWSFTGDGSLTSAPLVVNGCVYEASGNGHLYALDAATGAVLDTATLPAGVAAPDEQNAVSLTGLGAGGGALLVPASTWLVAYT